MQKELELLRVKGEIGSSLAAEVEILRERRPLPGAGRARRRSALRADHLAGAGGAGRHPSAEEIVRCAPAVTPSARAAGTTAPTSAPIPRIRSCAAAAWPICTAQASRARMPDQTMTAAEPRRVPWWSWLLVSAGVVGLDQLTKWLVQQVLVFGQSMRGAAVLQPGAGVQPRRGVQLPEQRAAAGSASCSSASRSAASALIVYLLRRHAHDRLFCFALSPDPGRGDRQRDRSPAAGSGGGFPRPARGGLSLAGVQPGRQRHHLGAGLLIWDSLRRRASKGASGIR